MYTFVFTNFKTNKTFFSSFFSHMHALLLSGSFLLAEHDVLQHLVDVQVLCQHQRVITYMNGIARSARYIKLYGLQTSIEL